MAVSFSSTARIDHGSGASLDGLAAAGMTVLIWLRRTSDGNNQHFLTKDNAIASGSEWSFLCANSPGEGAIRALVFRNSAANNADVSSVAGVLPLNTPIFVAIRYDRTDTQTLRIYAGTLTTLAAEVSYSSTSNGSGTEDGDGTASVWVGNLQRASTNPFIGEADRMAILSRAASLTEIQAMQFMSAADLGTVSGMKVAATYPNTAGSPYSDTTGNSNTGTLTGGSNATAFSVPTLIAPLATTTVYASPYNWYSDGGGSLQSNNINGSSTFIQSNTPGAYLRVKPTVSSGSPVLYMFVDTSVLNGLTASKCPYIGVSIDDGPLAFTQLVYSPTGMVMPISTGLSGTQKIKISFESIDLNSPGDRWTTPAQSVKVKGFYRDSSLLSLGTPTVRSKVALFFGDSLYEGANANFGTGLTVTDNAARYSLVPFQSEAFDAEYGVVAFGGIGIETKGIGFVTPSSSAPSLSNSTSANECWDKYSSGRSRLVSALFSPVPDYIFIRAGANDGGSLTAAHVTTFIDKVRTASSSTTWIFVESYLSNQLSAIDTGVANAAQTARTTAVHPPVVITLGTASKYSNDAVLGSQHANLWGNAYDNSFVIPIELNTIAAGAVGARNPGLLSGGRL